MAKLNKKIDLSKEASVANGDVKVEVKITEVVLKELCPKSVLAKFKAAKTPAARADFLFELNRDELKKLRDEFNEMDAFFKKLKGWFIQEFKSDQRGVTGKVGRVEIKHKDEPVVEDRDKFYAYVWKKKEFDLLPRSVKDASIRDRWDQGVVIPGIGHFDATTISLTSVKGK